MKRYDCGIVGNEFCVARDPQHHYLIKFTLKEGKWKVNKRGIVRISGSPFPGITMTMGYYEESPFLQSNLKESVLKVLMNLASK